MKKKDIIDQHIIYVERADQDGVSVKSKVSKKNGKFAELLVDAAGMMHGFLTSSHNDLLLDSLGRLVELKEPDGFFSFLNHVENVGDHIECVSFMINQKFEVFAYKRLDTIASMARVYYTFEDEKLYVAIPGITE